MKYTEVLKEIYRIGKICDILIEEFDNYWFPYRRDNPVNNGFADFEEYTRLKEEAQGHHLVELKKLYNQERLLRPIEYSDISSYGSVMTLSDFIEDVECGGFIDYDGFGRYIEDNKETNIEIYPSDLKNGLIRKEFKKIIWFNR